jgi:hypothetical protein
MGWHSAPPGGAMAAVAAAPPRRVMLVVSQVAGHLLGQRPLQHGLGHLGQQPVRAEQLGAPGRGSCPAADRPDPDPPAAAGRADRPRIWGALSLSCITGPYASRLSCGSSSGHVTFAQPVGHAPPRECASLTCRLPSRIEAAISTMPSTCAAIARTSQPGHSVSLSQSAGPSARSSSPKRWPGQSSRSCGPPGSRAARLPGTR